MYYFQYLMGSKNGQIKVSTAPVKEINVVTPQKVTVKANKDAKKVRAYFPKDSFKRAVKLDIRHYLLVAS
jgi:hypothetical protein